MGRRGEGGESASGSRVRSGGGTVEKAREGIHNTLPLFCGITKKKHSNHTDIERILTGITSPLTTCQNRRPDAGNTVLYLPSSWILPEAFDTSTDSV